MKSTLDKAFTGLADGSIEGILFLSIFRDQLKLLTDEGRNIDTSYWFKKLLETLPLFTSLSGEFHGDVDPDYVKACDTHCLPECKKAKHQFSLDKCLGTALGKEDWIKLSYGDKSRQCIFVGSLLPIRLGFESLFVRWSDAKAYEISMSCLRESICLSDTELKVINSEQNHHLYVKQNLHYLQNNLTLWHHIVAFGGLRLPFIDVARMQVLYARPLGTVVLSERLGSLICYPFLLDNLIICPIYSGWINKLESLYFVDLRERSSGFVCDDEGTNYLFNNSFNSMLNDALLHLLNSLSACKSPIVNDKRFLIGQRINYGHTIIQDATFMSALSCLDPSRRYPVLIGSHDYLCTHERLNYESEVNQSEVEYIHKYFIGPNTYAIPALECYPIPSYRPTSKSLAALKPRARIDSVNAEGAVYIHIDERTGKRRCANYSQIIDCIVSASNTYSIKTIIVDALTALPRPPGSVIPTEDTTRPDGPPAPQAYLSALEQLKRFSGEVIQSHGLTILQKQAVWAKYNVRCALVSYGSSMIAPIYLINCPAIIFGHEIHEKALTEWRWHTAKFCFDARLEEEYFVTSECHESGFNVNVNEIAIAFERLLDSNKMLIDTTTCLSAKDVLG